MTPFHPLGHSTAVSGVIIVSFYWLVSVGVGPYFTTPRSMTRVGAVYFFMLCGLTHFELSGHYLVGNDIETDGDFESVHMFAMMVPQALSVAMFAGGLYADGRIGVNVPPIVHRILTAIATNRPLNWLADVLDERLRTYASVYGLMVMALIAAGV